MPLIGKIAICEWKLANVVHRILYMFAFALRTPTWRRESLPVFKNIIASKTLGGCDIETFSLGIHCT